MRDAKKNLILDKCAIPLLRLRTDGSGEKEKIRNALKRIDYAENYQKRNQMQEMWRYHRK